MEILTTGETAKVLGIEKYQLDYLIETGRVMRPRKTIYGRRNYYTGGDIDKMRQIVERRSQACGSLSVHLN